MARLFVCSDPHFHHLNMIKNRGFETEEEYHDYFVKEWNSVVSKRDVVWILGDITMERNTYSILDRLNGIKKVVLGNHDIAKRSHTEELLKYVNTICSSHKMEIGGKKIVLTHIPIHPIEFDYRLDLNIHGHLHKIVIDDSRYINVCPEQIGYKPVEIEKLLEDVELKIIMRERWLEFMEREL